MVKVLLLEHGDLSMIPRTQNITDVDMAHICNPRKGEVKTGGSLASLDYSLTSLCDPGSIRDHLKTIKADG